RPAPPPAEAQVKLVAGTLAMSNSRDGAAVLTAAGMAPGDSRVGDVTITNTGDLTGTFSLSKSNLGDAPGPAGGTLSNALDLLAQDVTNAGAPATVYSGKLGAMGPRALGSWAPGASRTFRFTVSLPDGGAPPSGTSGDNAYQSSAVSVQYNWTATADEPPSGGGGSDGGGGGVPWPAPGPGPDSGPGTSPLELTLTGKKRQRLLRQGGLIVFVRCSEACSINATAKGQAARKVKVSAWSGRMKRGSLVKIKLRLSNKAMKSARKALKRRDPTAMTVTVRATAGAGKSTVRRLKISLG
ncbi:MAG: hypothetical protein ACRDM7_01350, partial [Thermoleophilaceae bacterium]